MGRENLMKARSSFAFEVSGFPYQGVNEVSTTQRYALGARYAEPHTERVFRYGKSYGACYAGRGVAIWNRMADGVDWTLLSGTQQLGDSQVTFAAATHPAFTKDQLQGGPILISDSDDGSGLADNNPQNRVMTGNDASAEDAACTVYLDQPLTRATAATTYAFCMPSPYERLKLGDTSSMDFAHAGVPGAYVDAADKYFWVQTWGPAWVAMHGSLSSKSVYQQEAVWHYNGTLVLRSMAQPTAHTYCQLAGYILDKGSSATFVQLMMSP